MPTPVTYPLDLSGIASTNFIQNELHTVSESRFKDYNFIVLNFSPFFIDNFHATITIGNVTRDLVEDVDFEFVLSYVTGTRVTGKAVYGGVTLHNLDLNGILSISYQTVGGDQVADRMMVLTDLADRAYNPRLSIWDILTNVPCAFPSSQHYQNYDTFFGQEQVVNALGEIRDAILQNASLTQAQISEFLTTINSAVVGNYVRRSGDAMTGRLTLVGAPVENLEAATKKYVDDNTVDINDLTSQLSLYYTAGNTDLLLNNRVAKSGDTMTGHLVLNANPTADMHAVNKSYLEIIKAELQAQIDAVAASIGSLSEGHVTKEYVDNANHELLTYIGGIAGTRS